MQLTALARSERPAVESRAADSRAADSRAVESPVAAPPAAERQVTSRRDASRRDADGMAVAAFVLGLVGLLVMNIVLGPIAVVLAALALWRGTARRGRALLGLALGLVDLAVLAVLVTMNGTIVWGFGV